MTRLKRTFLALPLAGAFQADLSRIVREMRSKSNDIKWVVPEQVHVTLHFFGPTTPEQLKVIPECVTPVAQAFSPLALGLKDIGFFPNAHYPRVVWIGLKGDTQKLVNLQAQIEAVLKGAGFECEQRAFQAHATIGRLRKTVKRGVAGDDLMPKDPARLETELARFNQIVLFESKLGPQGPTYEVLETFHFSEKP